MKFLKRIIAATLFLSGIMTGISARADIIKSLEEKGREAITAGDFRKALDIYRQFENITPDKENCQTVAIGLMHGGNVSLMLSEYESAIKLYKNSYKVSDEFNLSDMSEMNLNNIGCVYALLEHYRTAMFFFDRSIKSAKTNNNTDMVGTAAVNAAYAQCMLNNPDSAAYYIELQREYPLSDKRSRVFNLDFNEASLSIARKEWKKGIAGFHKSLKTAMSQPVDEWLLLRCYHALGNAYLNIDRPDSAVYWYNKALNLESNGDLFTLRRIYGDLASAYKQLGKDSYSGKYSDEYVKISDSIISLKQFDAIDVDLRQYEYDRAMLQINKRENIINDKNKLISVICVILILCLIIIIIITVNHKRLREAHNLLVKKNEMIIMESKIHSMAEKNVMNTNQPETDISLEESETGNPRVEEPELANKTAYTLKADQQIALYQKILRVMEDKSMICNPDFNISTLADAVDSNTKYVSFVINTLAKCNFKTFLNEYRIRAVCEKLNDIENYGKYTLETLSSEVGFKSTSTLYVTFKKVTGLTPAAYQRIQKENAKQTEEEKLN